MKLWKFNGGKIMSMNDKCLKISTFYHMALVYQEVGDFMIENTIS